MARLTRNLLLTGLAAAILTGCGGGSSDGLESASSDGLESALGDAAASGAGPVYFAWVDTVALRELSGLPESTAEAFSDQRWAALVSIVLGPELGSDFAGTDYGFDPMAGERTIAVGAPPDDATRYDGVDTDASGAGPVGINRVAVEGESLALGGFEEPVAGALGLSGEPLSDAGGFETMTACLGEDVFGASIRDPEDLAGEEVALSGVAVAGTDADEISERVCAVGAPGASLDAVEGCIEGAFAAGGADPATGVPYEESLGDVVIERGDAAGSEWVRAQFQPPAEAAVGQVFRLDELGAFAGPLGGVPFIGARATPETIEEELDC